ncbi:aromatic prenyltransferase [Nemania abortiva]|nr:aromatic prenyltransferase [Nemania abortiva]
MSSCPIMAKINHQAVIGIDNVPIVAEPNVGGDRPTSLVQLASQNTGVLDDDQEFWWKATAGSLSQLLTSCEYDKEDRISHLSWYRRWIIPALGPRPAQSNDPLHKSCLVFDGSTCEFSMNWKEREPNQIVRFNIEAMSHKAGTDADPFNQQPALDLLRRLSQEYPDLRLTQFEELAEEFFLSLEYARSLKTRLPPGTPQSRVWVGFDLVKGGFRAKAYFIPFLKATEEGLSVKELAFRAVKRLSCTYGSFNKSLSVLDDYLASFDQGNAPGVAIVAIDCFDSPEARLKIYLETTANTLMKVKGLYSLGGRLSSSEIDQGLCTLGQLWEVLFKLSPGDQETADIFGSGPYCGISFEMKPGGSVPEPKVYIPSRLVASDAQHCETLATWFAMRGHYELAKVYEERLRAAFPLQKMDESWGMHSFISFAYTSKSGAYMSMYYTTRIPEINLVI